MSSVQIDLEETLYEPGDEVAGRVIWDGAQHEELVLSLLWYTSGKGTEDVEVTHKETVPNPRPSGELDFRFPLPAFPWSFSGKLISLTWAIEASLEPGGGVQRVELVSAPDRSELRL
ncbi:MAG: hypothetical protein AAGN46_17110 [Acidobacteriota bacterium]